MLRSASQDSVEKARHVFGITFGIGCRNLPPAKGESERKLLHGDVVNIIDVEANVVQPLHQDTFNEFVSLQGIELVFQPETRVLSIRVRYCRTNAESLVVKRTLNFIPVVPVQTIPQHRRRNRAILVGTKFFLEGQLVEVTASDNEQVSIKNRYNGIEQQLNAEAAENLIRQYIMGH